MVAGGQQDIQVLGPLVVDLIVDVPQQQHQSTDHGGKEQGVDPLLTGALVDGPGQEKGGQGENQAEPAGLGKESAEPLIHGVAVLLSPADDPLGGKAGDGHHQEGTRRPMMRTGSSMAWTVSRAVMKLTEAGTRRRGISSSSRFPTSWTCSRARKAGFQQEKQHGQSVDADRDRQGQKIFDDLRGKGNGCNDQRLPEVFHDRSLAIG